MKRILTFFMTCILLVSCCSISVGAAAIFETAKTLKSGKTVKTQIDSGANDDYVIKCTKSGMLTIEYTVGMSIAGIYVFDSDGARVDFEKVTVKTGSYSDRSDHFRAYYDKESGVAVGTATYKVKKGTYYIRCSWIQDAGWAYNGNGFVSLKADYPSTSESKISYLQISIPKGTSLKLSAIVSGSGTVKWSSSKSSVASVSSKGTVKAKKKGTAIITAKLGNSSVKIRIKVT